MFTFKFQAVLNYRRQLEEARQQEFAGSKRQWEQARQKLEHYHGLWQQCIAQWRISQKSKPTINEIGLYRLYMQGLKNDINKQAAQVKHCLQEMEKKRVALLQASSAKKIMEKLKEKSRLQFLQEQIKREQKFINEVGLRQSYKRGQAS